MTITANRPPTETLGNPPEEIPLSSIKPRTEFGGSLPSNGGIPVDRQTQEAQRLDLLAGMVVDLNKATYSGPGPEHLALMKDAAKLGTLALNDEQQP
ncbi:hypothetical protein CR970_02050 [Candidatus Saccharibacteria bacterium]|nr:MAG: hypothetical protein CR970_02050 [Candidatus Saccharibacteria bacterium]